MTATRRLAAILFADVVGYSRLMGEDELGTALAVREDREAARPIILDHGGRIVQTIGDGVFLEFPSVVAAVECAIAFQKLITQRNPRTPDTKHIVYRIGINLGDVLIQGNDIIGESVNIAARLEAICEPGGIFISGAAFDHVRGRVDAHFIDLGEKELKNIARPVRVFAVSTDIESQPGSAPSLTASSAPPLSLMVLPFTNLSSDPRQDYFVDGVTDSLTTDLSRIHGSFVIGRNTAFTYKGKHADLKRIGREVNVRYVLEGSIQRSGQRMRVNVQLIDAESGNHLWAERFDTRVSDLFDVQDEIVARLARVLAARMVEAEARRAERTQNPDAQDNYFQGWAWIYKGITPDNLIRARDSFDRALKIDPDNVDALSGRAWVDIVVAKTFPSGDSPASLAAAEAAMTKALSLAPGHAIAHETMGMVLIYTNRADRGIEQFERALALNPNLPGAHAQIGAGKLFLGLPEEVERHISSALRLSPIDMFAYVWLTYRGLASLLLGRDAEAIDWLRRSIEVNRNYPRSHFLLAAAFAHLGWLEEARAALDAGLAFDHGFTIARARENPASLNPAYLRQYERIHVGLRIAGAPER